MKKQLVSIFAFSFLSLCFALGQTNLEYGRNNYQENKGIIYQKELGFYANLQTRGFGLGATIGAIKTYYLTRFINIEIGSLKHIREYRQSFDFQAPTTNRISRAFIFGKQNAFYPLRVGFGEKRYLSEKAKQKGLAIGITYEAGPTLGLLKPYYLDLWPNEIPGAEPYIRSEKYSSANESTFLNVGRIYGASGFGKGLGELKIMPGAHAKLAIHFDWGAYDEMLKGMEAGVMADFFFKEVPIMVETTDNNLRNTPLFLNLYLHFILGKRW